MPEEFLMELGFTKNESKVYFSLLKSGSITAGQISSDISIHRTNVYDCLERLIEKGLVNYIHKEGKKFYQASDPEKIKDILVEKERKFREVLPNMLKLKKDMPQNDLAEIHRGMKAFRMILYSLLRKKSPILVYGIPKVALTYMEDFIYMYHKIRIKRRVVMKHIYDEDATKRIEYLNKLPYTYARKISKLKNSPVSTLICGGEIYFILWGESMYIIKIKNEKIANSYKKYFNILWKISEV